MTSTSQLPAKVSRKGTPNTSKNSYAFSIPSPLNISASVAPTVSSALNVWRTGSTFTTISRILKGASSFWRGSCRTGRLGWKLKVRDLKTLRIRSGATQLRCINLPNSTRKNWRVNFNKLSKFLNSDLTSSGRVLIFLVTTIKLTVCRKDSKLKPEDSSSPKWSLLSKTKSTRPLFIIRLNISVRKNNISINCVTRKRSIFINCSL